MQLTLDDFCELVKELNKTNAEKAVAVLWFHDYQEEGVAISSGRLTKILDDHHLGTPNQTQLAESIRKTKLTNEGAFGFSLKPGSRRLIREWFPNLDGIQPKMDHAAGYLPQPVWKNTRPYIEAVCLELNGCFKSGYFNAAAVMLRRLLETLIIEAYEHLGRESEVKDGNGNYLMLKDLAERVCGEKGHKGLTIGRNSKQALKEAREIGNFSAHARYFIAHAPDLVKLGSGVRVLAQELIQIAELQKV